MSLLHAKIMRRMKLYNIKMEVYIATCQMVLNDLSKVNCHLTDRCRIGNLNKNFLYLRSTRFKLVQWKSLVKQRVSGEMEETISE